MIDRLDTIVKFLLSACSGVLCVLAFYQWIHAAGWDGLLWLSAMLVFGDRAFIRESL